MEKIYKKSSATLSGAEIKASKSVAGFQVGKRFAMKKLVLNKTPFTDLLSFRSNFKKVAADFKNHYVPIRSYGAFDKATDAVPSGTQTIFGGINTWDATTFVDADVIPTKTLYVGDTCVDTISLFYTACLQPTIYGCNEYVRQTLENFFDGFAFAYYGINDEAKLATLKQTIFLPAALIGVVDNVTRQLAGTSSSIRVERQTKFFIENVCPYLATIPNDFDTLREFLKRMPEEPSMF